MKCEEHIFLDLFLFYSVELFGIRVNSTVLFCFQIFSVASRVSLSICSFQPGLHTVNIAPDKDWRQLGIYPPLFGLLGYLKF